jgi:GNAT superfamily N-acetyltransferase
VPADEVSLRPTIDRPWLEEQVDRDPSLHAFSLWDLDRFPTKVQFVSALAGERTIGYLLVWLGAPRSPIVHWFGESSETRVLADGLPSPPFGLVVPEIVRSWVEPRLGPVETVPMRLLEVPRGTPPTAGPLDPSVRKLTGRDVPELLRLTTGQRDFAASAYPHVDPEAEPVWGYFEGERLRGVARTSVRLPRVWFVTGVFVEPEARSRGHALAIMRSVLDEGHRAGVTVALYVRGDRPAPQAVYAKAGFRERARRVWLGAGTTLEP